MRVYMLISSTQTDIREALHTHARHKRSTTRARAHVNGVNLTAPQLKTRCKVQAVKNVAHHIFETSTNAYSSPNCHTFMHTNRTLIKTLNTDALPPQLPYSKPLTSCQN